MKNILYHGIDHDFSESLMKTVGAIAGASLKLSFPDKGLLPDLVLQERPHIVIVDAGFAGYLAEEIRLLKSTPLHQSLVVAAFCKDETELRDGEILLSAGAVLLHLKDNDFETFFRDCFQIAFGESIPVSGFARAEELEIPLDLEFLSVLASVTSETVRVESDLSLGDSETMLLPVGSTSELTLEVQARGEGSMTGNHLHSYQLKLPYPGPWDELSPGALTRDTVETWLELRKNTFDPRFISICVITKAPDLIRALLKGSLASWYHIFEGTPKNPEQLRGSSPALIFYDLPTMDDGAIEELGTLVSIIRELDPKPMVIVSQSLSDSQALRKLFDYPYILAFPGALGLNMMEAMENKYREKMPAREKEHFLKLLDEDRILWIRRRVVLTSISERDMTFIIPEEIPYFSVARCLLPLPGFLTIVPAEGRLPPRKEGHHYRAVIHGLGEENLARLRKIVNQLIYRKVTELTKVIVEVMLKQDYIEKPPVHVRETVPPDSPEPEHRPEADRFLLVRRTKGRSKL